MAGSYVYVSEVTTVEASRCTRKKEEKIQAQGRQRQQWTLAGVACSSLPCDSHLIASPNFLHPPFPTCRSRLRWSPYIASMEGGGHVIFYSMSGPWLELPLSQLNMLQSGPHTTAFDLNEFGGDAAKRQLSEETDECRSDQPGLAGRECGNARRTSTFSKELSATFATLRSSAFLLVYSDSFQM
jgi:hypothetical protein